jgi:hypothetical protein
MVGTLPVMKVAPGKIAWKTKNPPEDDPGRASIFSTDLSVAGSPI